MGIYIAGMEMPGIGESVTIYPDGRVIRYDTYTGGAIRGKAIPVPPHGRLIDADDAARKTRRFANCGWVADPSVFASWLVDGDFSTIIPADPAEEGEA